MSNAYLQAVAPLKLPSTRKFVLFVLADMANDDGLSFASVANLIERTCLTERTIQMGLSDLEGLGILDRDFRRGRSTHYRLTDPAGWNDLLPPVTPAADAPPQDVHPRTRCAPTPAPDAPAPAPDAPAPAPDAPITITQPSLNPKSEPKTSLASLALVLDDDSTSETKPRKQRKRPGSTGEPEGWAEFWKVYPRKVSRSAALKAWRKLAPDDALRAVIMRGLAAQLPALLASEPRYRPHPATWLNGERWNDEPIESELSTGSSATVRGLVALQRMKGTGNVTQDFEAAWAQQPRQPAGMLPRDPRSEEEQLEAMIAGSLDPEATRALLHAESTEES